MKPDYDAMTIKELKVYLLEHRNDTEAISTIVEKIKADPNTKWYAPEDTDRFPEIYEEHRKRREADQNS
jgi:hypothetical protein